MVALVLANTSATPNNLMVSTLDEEPSNAWSQGDWKTFEESMIAGLRTVAPEYTIHVGFPGTSFWTNVTGGTTRSDSNLTYANHFYSPTQFATQGQGFASINNIDIYDLPWPVDAHAKAVAQRGGTTNADSLTAIDTAISDGVDEAEIRDRFRQLYVWATANNAKIIVSEFGTSTLTPSTSRQAYLSAMRGHMASRNFGGCQFSYDQDGLSGANRGLMDMTDGGNPGSRAWLPGILPSVIGVVEGWGSANAAPPTTTTTVP